MLVVPKRGPIVTHEFVLPPEAKEDKAIAKLRVTKIIHETRLGVIFLCQILTP
jgi:hypothetical protein